MNKVYELEYLEMEGNNINFNYFLYKNLVSQNMVDKIKLLKSEALESISVFNDVLCKFNLPQDFTSEDIPKLWAEKPPNQCYVIVFEARLNNWEFFILLKEKVLNE